ncbi:hypothetical protein DSL72_002623 [Monilinia vaccinii-corymbosi]|uniref:Uncharacterized protein n=1 Tax=Monilinia vaccinii-corymbosi TaxID=61207 RepID=A0A8A3PD68_9HELO|nr:hypothetical protein DSL72_002623 [Monilinia vaccinii-corymbosi]
MDAGGLAQMSYNNNNFPTNNGLGMPITGFAARRAANGPNLKRLSFEHNTKNANAQENGASTPRTSRSHLLAGLRTAPKSTVSANFPSTAPPTQLQHNTANNGLNSSRFADNGPKTSGYGQFHQGNQMNQNHVYSLPEQILSPPEIHIDDGQDGMDPSFYAHLVATNLYLAEQQQRLQQQLMSVQAAAHQMQGMNLNGPQYSTPHGMGMYQQQMKQNMQPIITPVMGAQPNLYSYFNPMTGQQTFFMDNNGQQYVEAPVEHRVSYSPPRQCTPRFQVSPPPSDTPSFKRSISPPKKSSSPPQDHAPLPPPSAGAFRRGHRTSKSGALSMSGDVIDGPKTAGLPRTNFGTPIHLGFGPGAGRAGEHPVRQPRNPPSIEELQAKPTAKFEGSKNFATRTRRSAVHNLVRAGLERRRAPGSASGSISPVSEDGEISFSNDDNDSDSGRSGNGSGSLSGRPNLPSSRTSQHGAIGSNRPSSRQDSFEVKSVVSVDSFTAESVSGDEQIGGSFAAVFKNGGKKPETVDVQKKAPMLVLTSAEKRKGAMA